MLRFLRNLLGFLGGLLDEGFRVVMLHYGRDLAAEEAEAEQAEAARTRQQANAAREREVTAETERRHAEQLDATLELVEAIRGVGLVPTSVMPDVVRIHDPEAAQARMGDRAARVQASREQFRLLFPARRERPPVEEMVVRSGWPRIVDPEASPTNAVGYGR